MNITFFISSLREIIFSLFRFEYNKYLSSSIAFLHLKICLFASKITSFAFHKEYGFLVVWLALTCPKITFPSLNAIKSKSVLLICILDLTVFQSFLFAISFTIFSKIFFPKVSTSFPNITFCFILNTKSFTFSIISKSELNIQQPKTIPFSIL